MCCLSHPDARVCRHRADGAVEGRPGRNLGDKRGEGRGAVSEACNVGWPRAAEHISMHTVVGNMNIIIASAIAQCTSEIRQPFAPVPLGVVRLRGAVVPVPMTMPWGANRAPWSTAATKHPLMGRRWA